jgi:hypothetical protein
MAGSGQSDGGGDHGSGVVPHERHRQSMASERASSVKASRSMLTLPSASAVMPRTMATSIGRAR